MVTVKCKRIHHRESVMNIQDLAKINQQELRDFYLSSKESMLYTDYKYLSLLQEHLSCDIKYLVHYEGSKIIAAMPFAIKESKHGKIYNSLPYYGSNGGVISSSNSNELKLNLVNKFFSIAEKIMLFLQLLYQTLCQEIVISFWKTLTAHSKIKG